jgi:hypothetical protein
MRAVSVVAERRELLGGRRPLVQQLIDHARANAF